MLFLQTSFITVFGLLEETSLGSLWQFASPLYNDENPKILKLIIILRAAPNKLGHSGPMLTNPSLTALLICQWISYHLKNCPVPKNIVCLMRLSLGSSDSYNNSTWEGHQSSHSSEMEVTIVIWGLPAGSDGKESYNSRDLGSIPGSGGSPRGGNATHSRILSWEIPWTEESGGL